MLKKVLAALVIISLMFVATGFAYDKNPGSFKEFPLTYRIPDYQEYEDLTTYVDVSTSITKILVLGTAEGLYPDMDTEGKTVAKRGVGIFGQEGSGFYVGRGYFVTNAHVVMPSAVAIQQSKHITWITRPIKILTLQIMIGQNTGLGSCPGELIWIDYEYDLAIIKVVGNWPALEALEYELGWTLAYGDRLYPGMAIATIVAIRQDPKIGDYSKSSWFEVRYGEIIDTHAVVPGPLGEGHDMELVLPWFNVNDVTTTLTIYPGDSGSPVFGFVEGRPVIIGVARASANYCSWTECWYSSYFTRIDAIIPFTMEK